MLLRLGAEHVSDFTAPHPWRRWVGRNGSTIEVTGDRTADTEIFLYRGSEVVYVATDLGELLDELHGVGLDPELDPWGISSLLHHGLVRLPRTEYANVYLLAMGDGAAINWSQGEPSIRWSFAYPWLNEKSAQDQRPDTRVLLDLITAATEQKLKAANNTGVLMLSSGKDSTAIALALAEGGFRSIPTVTYGVGLPDPEPPIAAAVSSRLGLEHRVVELPTDLDQVAAVLLAFFAASPRACVDLSQIPYALAAATFEQDGGAVFDGGGNDSYMGLLPSPHDVIKDRFRIRGKRASELASRWAPVHTSINYLTRSRAAATFAGRTLRFRESQRLYPEAIDTEASLWQERRTHRDTDLIDLYGLFRERHGDPAGSMLKQRLAASSVGMSAAMPFCDHDVADYYFHLPESSRFLRATMTNKTLLREMLVEFLDYDADAVGKHYFAFDGAAFVLRHKALVRSEIDACDLWNSHGLALVHGWLDRVEARPLLYHALLTIFMISGWHNHSRYVTRTATRGAIHPQGRS